VQAVYSPGRNGYYGGTDGSGGEVTAMHERISIDPQVYHGQACVKGTRVPVHQVVGMLANGDTIDDLLREFPNLQREDILACLQYAADLTEEEVTPLAAVPSAE